MHRLHIVGQGITIVCLAEEDTGGDPELEPDVKPKEASPEEEDEVDEEVAKRKAKQLARKGISFEAKDDGKVRIILHDNCMIAIHGAASAEGVEAGQCLCGAGKALKTMLQRKTSGPAAG